MRKVQSKPTQAQVWNHATIRTRAGFEPVNGYEKGNPGKYSLPGANADYSLTSPIKKVTVADKMQGAGA